MDAIPNEATLNLGIIELGEATKETKQGGPYPDFCIDSAWIKGPFPDY